MKKEKAGISRLPKPITKQTGSLLLYMNNLLQRSETN
jgi:hypothetical protein